MFASSGIEIYGDISSWNVSNVKNMTSMFYKCDKITSLDLSSWNTEKLQDCPQMFYMCHNLTSVGDLSGWKADHIVSIRSMFYECENLKDIGDINNWNITKYSDMIYAFKESGITNIPSWYRK